MVTQTTPFRAKRPLPYAGTAPDPFENAPPWIHTMTGRSRLPGSGVQTLRFRQSSPGIAGSAMIASKGGKYGGLGTVGPYSNASLTPSQVAGGRGCSNRLGPKGAAA